MIALRSLIVVVLFASCASMPKQGDFNCDGKRDRAWLERSGDRVFVRVVFADVAEPAILEFGVGDSSAQDSLCGETVRMEIENLDEDARDIEGYARSSTCKGLRLIGGECDPIHVYWNHAPKKLDWWRL